MKLILITSPTYFVEEDQILTALFEEGLDYLHLRKPNMPAVYAERLLTLIPEKFHNRIITHDHFYLQKEFNLLGVHLSQRNPEPPEDYDGHLTRSCHSLEEVKQAKASCDYVFLSPIFDSISKEGYQSNFTIAQLEEAKKEKIIDHKVMALGGICQENIAQVKKLGFGGAAFLGDVWGKFEPNSDTNYLAIIEHFKKLRNAF